MMNQIKKFKWVFISLVLFCSSAFLLSYVTDKIDNKSRFSLTLVPPSPVTNKVKLDIRGAIWNNSAEKVNYKISLYVDKVRKDLCVYSKDITIQPEKNGGLQFMLNTEKYAGDRKIIMRAESALGLQIINRRR